MRNEFDPKRLAAIVAQADELLARSRLMAERSRDAAVRLRHLRGQHDTIEREMRAFLRPSDRTHHEASLAKLAPQITEAEAAVAEAKDRAQAAFDQWSGIKRLATRCEEFALRNEIPLPPPALADPSMPVPEPSRFQVYE